MKLFQKALVGVLGGIVALTVAACGQQPGVDTGPATAKPADGKLTIYTSFYPLYFVTEKIAGDHADVINIVPPGVEPHDFEPTAKDIVAMSQGQVLVYNGSGLEAWIDKAITSFDQTNMTVVNATDGLPLLPISEEEHDHAAESQGSEHDHGEFDPHVWLDPTLLKAQAEKVKDALVKTDQAHSQDYVTNYEKLAGELDRLDKEFQDVTASAKQKEIVVAHSAFGYLAHKYGLTQTGVSGLTPEAEPSPAELKQLVEHVKEHNIHYILFETLVSPKVAEVIARETGAKTATLNPLEGLTVDEANAGKDYLSIMRENLETLRLALQ